MTHAALILALPRMYATLQFGFRLESYVLMGLSGTLLAALALTAEGGHQLARWRWLLVPVAIASVIGAAEQVAAYTPGRSRDTALASFNSPVFEQEGLLDYVDDSLPILRTPLPRIDFPPSTAHGGDAVAFADPRRGRRFDSNLRAAPGLVHVSGARIVATDAQADDVLEVDAPADPPRREATRDSPRREATRDVPRQGATQNLPPSAVSARIAISPSRSLPVRAGRLLTLLALAILAAELGLSAIRRRTAAKSSATITHQL
jgi:hypothetical protein